MKAIMSAICNQMALMPPPMKRFIGVVLLTMASIFSASTIAAGDPVRPLRIGLTPTFPSDQYRPLEKWRLYMEHKLQRPVEFIRRDRYIETMDLLRLKKLDFAWVCDHPYVYFKKWLRLLAVPVYKGRPYYQSYLIVPAADKATVSLAQLKDKVFAYTDPYSNTGYLAVRLQLQRAGEDPARYFRKTFFVWSHRRVLEAVAVHEAVILRIIVGRAAGGDGLAHQGVHRGTAVARQADQHLGALGGVAYRLGREALETLAREQHDEDVAADDHAGRRFVGEFLVEAEAEPGKEGDRTLEVGDRQIDEDLLCRHGVSR